MRKDRKRHGDINVMDYKKEKGDPEEEEVWYELADEDKEQCLSAVNPEAHQPHQPSDGLEQAGVSHLAHGWIQQGQPKKVCSARFYYLFHFFFFNLLSTF